MTRHCSILMVEDDADDVYFMTRALQESGLKARVDVVNDGQSAVNFLRDASLVDRRATDALTPCLVLLDLNLPVKQGLDVLKWIRQESTWETIIVVILTSSTAETDMRKAYSLGANSYVIKPTDATKLTQLAEHIKGFWFEWTQLPPAPL